MLWGELCWCSMEFIYYSSRRTPSGREYFIPARTLMFMWCKAEICSTLRAHWLSLSGGGEQGQTRHGGTVFKKAKTAQGRLQNWRGKISHARGTGSFCAMCSRDTSFPWRTQKQTKRTTRHQSTSSLFSISERVAPGSPVTRIGLNRRVLTWLYTRT